MMPLFDPPTIRSIEPAAAEAGVNLMARAGLAIAEWIGARYPASASVLAVTGRGNNGGDALVAGGLLVVLFGLWTLPGPHQAWLMGH